MLQERNFGDLRGLPYDRLGFDPLASDAAPPGGESQARFAARVRAAWDLVLAQAASGPLAVVTHGLVIREWLLCGPLTLAHDVEAPARLANTALTVAEAAPPYRVALLASTAHLDATTANDRRSLSGG